MSERNVLAPHPEFEYEGEVVRCVYPMDYYQAPEGTTITITLTGATNKNYKTMCAYLNEKQVYRVRILKEKAYQMAFYDLVLAVEMNKL